jgi:hypothetical protein
MGICLSPILLSKERNIMLPLHKIYPPNPTCMKHNKGQTTIYDATIPPSSKLGLPARVVFRCTMTDTHTIVLPLLCSYEEYRKHRDGSWTRLVHKLVPKFECLSIVQV